MQTFVEMFYCVPGDLDPSQIRKRVEWLVTNGVFRFGGIDISVSLHILDLIFIIINQIIEARIR